MPVAIEWSTSGPGATAANYDELIKRMGAVPGGPHPGEGCLFHWIRVAPDGLHGADVWETQADFDNFAATKLGPLSEELGLPKVRTKSYETHNYLTAH